MHCIPVNGYACGLVFIRQVESSLYLLGLFFGLFLYVCLFVGLFLCLFVGLFLCVCATGTGTCDGLPSAREGEGSVYINTMRIIGDRCETAL